MRRALIASACVLVAGCGGSDPPKRAETVRTATQPRPTPPSVEVSLRGEDTRRVVFGHDLEIRGVVRQSRPSGPLTVRLLASREPVESTTTGEGGSFRFTVQPRVNTIYSVQVGDKVSRHIQVYAMPEGNFRVEPISPGSGYFVYEITYPRGVEPTKRPVQFYAHFTGGDKRFARVGEARFRHYGPERSVARVKITLDRPADDAVACVPAMIAKDFGDPPIPDCGKRRVRVKRHQRPGH
jgi:hypothetical protein